MAPLYSREIERIHAGGRRGLGQSVGLDQRDAGDLLPALGDRALHGHAAAEGQMQFGEIDLVESRRVEQPVEQRVDAGHCRETDALQQP